MAIRALLPPDVDGGTLGRTDEHWLDVFTDAINSSPVNATGLFADAATAEAGVSTDTAITPSMLKHILQYYSLIA